MCYITYRGSGKIKLTTFSWGLPSKPFVPVVSETSGWLTPLYNRHLLKAKTFSLNYYANK